MVSSSSLKCSRTCLRHRVEAIVAGDEVVLARQLLLQPRRLLEIERRTLDQFVDFVVQVRVDELQLGRAVLVIERHRGAVLDRLLEVVDRDVVAENLLRPFVARDQRRTGESEEERLRQPARMFIASVSYWLRCASSVNTITSGRSHSISDVWNLWISVNT